MFNVIVVDDEKPAIKKMVHQLESLDGFDINIRGTYCSPAEAFESLGTARPDLVFLDIEMPGINGLEAAERMLELRPEADIVFVTAYDKYALEAFEVNAADYLLKPVMTDRLAKTLTRIRNRRPAPRGAAPVGEDYSIQTFGGPDITKNGQPLNVKWRSAKVRELFAYYVHHRGNKLHRTRILEELWPDMEYERALANFNTCNYQLRKQLAETGAGIRLLFANGYYALETRGNACDADLMDDILLKNTSVTRSNVGLITKALDLYKGAYCENITGLWADSRRYYYENLFVSSAVSAADYFLKTKMYGECLEYAQKAVEKNRLFEEGWRLILKALKLLGDTGEYNAKYESMRKIFDKDLGEAPDI